MGRAILRPRSIRGLLHAQSGLAITEFAFLLPIMLLVYCGTIEISQSVSVKRRLNLAVSTMGDLTGRVSTVSATDIASVFGSAGAVMAPIDVSTLKMRISSVIVYPGGTNCVDWSVGSAMTALTGGSSITLPPGIAGSSSTVSRNYILVEATIAFAPITHKVIPGTITLKEGPTYLVPRQADRVVADATIQASSPCS